MSSKLNRRQPLELIEVEQHDRMINASICKMNRKNLSAMRINALTEVIPEYLE